MGRYGTDSDDGIEFRSVPTEPTEIETPRSRSRRTVEPSDMTENQVRTLIKDIMWVNPYIGARELKTEMERLGLKISLVTVSNIRTEYRHTLKFLIDHGATHLQRLF